MNQKNAIIIFVVLVGVLWSLPFLRRPGAVATALANMPVQYEGRVKSFNVFSKEVVRLITTRGSWHGEPAWHFVLDAVSGRKDIRDTACVRVNDWGLKKLLGLGRKKEYFSYRELAGSFPAITSLLQRAQEKSKTNERLSRIERKAQGLYGRLSAVDMLYSGELVDALPAAPGKSWASPFTAGGPQAAAFMNMMKTYASGNEAKFVTLARQWDRQAQAVLSARTQRSMQLENWYYRIKPFMYAWICYLVGFLLFVFSRRPFWKTGGVVLISAGAVAHTLGLALRTIILLRPPVSNMYESMIFMDWILIICALLFFAFKRNTFFLTAGALVSAMVMIYADLLPIDRSMGVLMPVLRSNYWLIMHVMTIVASYGIFGLCMAVGHRHLFLEVTGRLGTEARQESASALVRLMQIGILLLGIGTVLGGVWANESWGSFWSWDPKETWALITFLGYLTIIHWRISWKMSDFWLAVSSVLGFLLVLMTWYGVNFLLGRGLHSYGYSAGGVIWIVYYLIFEVVFFGFVIWKRLGGANKSVG